MKNYAQYSAEAQNPDKMITENAVRKFDGWDFEDEDHVAKQFAELRSSEAVKFIASFILGIGFIIMMCYSGQLVAELIKIMG